MQFSKYPVISSLVFLVAIIGCRQKGNEAIKTQKITFSKQGELQVFKTDSTQIILDVEFAESDYEIQTGLMYRESMGEKQAMLFIFPGVRMHSFYMKNTEFPLDIIFINDSLKIASFQKNAEPLNETGLSSKVPVKYVLEINSGLVDKWNLKIGDSVAYSRSSK